MTAHNKKSRGLGRTGPLPKGAAVALLVAILAPLVALAVSLFAHLINAVL